MKGLNFRSFHQQNPDSRFLFTIDADVYLTNKATLKHLIENSFNYDELVFLLFIGLRERQGCIPRLFKKVVKHVFLTLLAKFKCALKEYFCVILLVFAKNLQRANVDFQKKLMLKLKRLLNCGVLLPFLRQTVFF